MDLRERQRPLEERYREGVGGAGTAACSGDLLLTAELGRPMTPRSR